VCRGEVPDKSSGYWSHRDFAKKRIETLWVSKPDGRILAVDLGRTRVSILERHRDIGGIGVLEVKKLETPRVKHRRNHSRGSRTGHASEIQSESGFDISGFLKTKELLHQESRFRDTR
jgi:hypothetical protein